ncbi:hypothetical protein SAMN05421759_102641 [Roseivivax lentus]|uniref:Uncharacterized protein n=1 Tax=Roseivivax lentus TaxID=633194 RepID=A0A1N7LET3_9RHOB|nr:hypothetical protein [Roseivivax lentus]SIS72320.1 hypothetical protein SAMN05421759_102641 [Roseivivax lentus]
MLARKLPPSQIHLGGGAITLSKKVCSFVAQAAIDKSIATIKAFHNEDDPLASVEEIHKDWDELRSLQKQLEDEAKDFSAAADALEGTVVEGTSPLIELAVVTRASFDTLSAIDNEYDTSVLQDTAKTLREVADALYADLSVLKSRRIKHDNQCRRAVLKAMAEGVDPLELHQYELPEDFELPIQGKLNILGEGKSSTQQWREDCQKAAAKYFQDEADAATANKRAQKAESRKKVRREIKELWT